MRIDSLSPMMARNLLAALPKSVSGLTNQPEPAPQATPQAFATPGTVATASVQMLVAIAVNNPVAERRRKMARDAERGIDALDRLHKELLAGTPNVARLREFARLSQASPMPEDPTLAQLMRDIDLRVRVELAKFDVEV